MDSNINRIYLVVILVIIVAAASIYFLKYSKTVEMGDTVYINYTATLDTGEIFDTTLEEVALDDSYPKVWWFRLRAAYEPIKIVVGKGTGTVLPDLEMALIGMREGEKKKITISPERVAGYRDPNKIKEVPLVQTLAKEEEVSVEDFKKNLGQDPVVDEYYQFQGLPILVLEVKEEKVHFRYDLQMGQEIYISLGAGRVTEVTETEYQITLEPSLGDVIYLPIGQGRVIEVREDAMLVDFNPLLAGETVHYSITVVEIEKAE